MDSNHSSMPVRPHVTLTLSLTLNTKFKFLVSCLALYAWIRLSHAAELVEHSPSVVGLNHSQGGY